MRRYFRLYLTPDGVVGSRPPRLSLEQFVAKYPEADEDDFQIYNDSRGQAGAVYFLLPNKARLVAWLNGRDYINSLYPFYTTQSFSNLTGLLINFPNNIDPGSSHLMQVLSNMEPVHMQGFKPQEDFG
jgi:hypothetical protein